MDLDAGFPALQRLRKCLRSETLASSLLGPPTTQTCSILLDLNLFDDKEVAIQFECFYRLEQFDSSRPADATADDNRKAICHGRVTNDAPFKNLFSALLFVGRDTIAGFVERANGDRYNIVPMSAFSASRPAGQYLVTETRREQLWNERRSQGLPGELLHKSATTPRRDQPETISLKEDSEAHAMAGSIDILVLITWAARETAMGTGNARLIAEMSIESANLVLHNTLNGTSKYYTMVGFIEHGMYDEGFDSLADELDRISYGGEFFYTIEEMRAAHGADLVSLIADASYWYYDQSMCGIAWIAATRDYYFQSATHLDCLISGTFAHELGHNMGCHHSYGDGGEGGGPGPSPSPTYFNYCYRVDGEFRTIMANDSATVYTPRYPIFSSPSLTIGGKPAGDSGHNNALMLSSDGITEPSYGTYVGWSTIMDFRTRQYYCTSNTNACTTTSSPVCCSHNNNICCNVIYESVDSSNCCSDEYPNCCTGRGASGCCPRGYPNCCLPNYNFCCKSGYTCSSGGCTSTMTHAVEPGVPMYVHGA